jgi:uncharacterized protein YbaR (Trm112 family)
MTKKSNISVLRFKAQVWQIKTLVDGGINITLALSENEIEQVAGLLECKRRGAILEVAAIPVLMNKEMEKKDAKEKTDSKNKSSRRRERYPYHN